MVWVSGKHSWITLLAVAGGLAAACGDDGSLKPPQGLAGRGGAAGSSAGKGGGSAKGGGAGRTTGGQAGNAGEAGADASRAEAGEAGAPARAGGPSGGSGGGAPHHGGEGGEVVGGDAGTGTAGEGVAGAAGGSDEPEPTPIPVVDETGLPSPVARAGFIEIAPVTYTTRLGGAVTERTSTRNRLFYNLRPADTDAKSKPVFVVFNGGPGAASALLRSFGTGPRTLDGDAPEAASTANATSLTSLGNLLYIDARHAGYSYNLAEDASDATERAAAFNSQSVNESIDAADFVRVVLRVLALEPSLRNNPVVLMGESYGGVRAPLMLYFLLNPGMLKDPAGLYYDPALGDEVSAHLAAVFQEPSSELGQTSIAKQFGWQILLEPAALANYQMLDQSDVRAEVRASLEQELGLSESELAARCLEDVSRTQAWCDAVQAGADRVSQDAAEFQAFDGLAPSAVAQFAAGERGEAFRVIDADPDPLTDPLGLGALPDWDRYYFPFSGSDLTDTGFTFVERPTTGFIFVYTTAYVETLVTNARYDTNVFPLTLVPALRKVVSANPIVGLVAADYVGDDPDEPSDAIRLRYQASTFLPRSGERLIRFPSFPQSGHFVSVTEPERLYTEVESFLAASGL